MITQFEWQLVRKINTYIVALRRMSTRNTRVMFNLSIIHLRNWAALKNSKPLFCCETIMSFHCYMHYYSDSLKLFGLFSQVNWHYAGYVGKTRYQMSARPLCGDSSDFPYVGYSAQYHTQCLLRSSFTRNAFNTLILTCEWDGYTYSSFLLFEVNSELYGGW